MSLAACCVKGFTWGGQPAGRTIKLAGGRYDAYVAGDDGARAAVLVIHDAFGWGTPNVRLLADHYAREAGVAVYVPDFFEGERIRAEDHPGLSADQFLATVAWPFVSAFGRDRTEPAIVAVARALRAERGHAKVGAIGFCYGGWAVLRLGGKAGGADGPLIDAAAIAHPSLVTEADVDALAVPLLVLAPEHDAIYTPALKQYTFTTVPANGVALDYLHFPGVEHGALVRGDESVPGERAAMVRAKNAAVNFFTFHLVAEEW